MVSEKVSAAAASQTAATAALLGGKGLKRAAAAALVPLKRASEQIIAGYRKPTGLTGSCRTRVDYSEA
jgi:hypothetical protein